MTDVDTEPVAPRALGRRIREILVHPNQEWPVIEAEPATIRGLYANYICLLAAIGPLCQAMATIIYGSTALGIVYRPPVLLTAMTAVVSYVLTLAGVFVMAVVVEALAPAFGGVRSRVQALKVVAYSATPAFLAGLVYLVPPLSLLTIFSVYSFYLLYRGLPVLMKAPGDKGLVYTTVVIVTAIVIGMLVASLLAPLIMAGVSPPAVVLGA